MVMTVWQSTRTLDSFAWSGAMDGMVDFVELDRAAAEDSGRVAAEGVRIAQDAGLRAGPVAIKAVAPVWTDMPRGRERSAGRQRLHSGSVHRPPTMNPRLRSTS
jgi:hypothetical protein